MYAKEICCAKTEWSQDETQNVRIKTNGKRRDGEGEGDDVDDDDNEDDDNNDDEKRKKKKKKTNARMISI